jgi:hypothetical protein
MPRHDWLSIGLKLLGVYFGISGLAALWNVMLVLMAASTLGAHVEGLGVIGILQPAAYLVAAFLLVRRTPYCLRWCGDSEPTVGTLEKP